MGERYPKVDSIVLWEKTAQSGKHFMSGIVEIEGKKFDVVIFQNENKKETRHPDWSWSKPKEPQAY